MLARMPTFSVPASTTNLGHGFDCLGIALGLTNRIAVEPSAGEAVVAPGAADAGLAPLAATVRDSQTSLELSRQLYERGLTDFLKVLDAQRTLLSARQQLADSGTTLSTDLVTLYKALGGGWESQFPEQTASR